MAFLVNTNLSKLEKILELKHISKSFNGLVVLEDVSFSLESGSITALFGENGSGKTTLFHIVSGFLKANKGEVTYQGNDLSGKSAVEISRLGIGRVWQTPRLFKNLSVADNILLAVKDHPGDTVLNYFFHPRLIWKGEKQARVRTEAVAADIGLTGKLQKTAGSLSFGQQKLLSIGMLLMNGAQLLLLDEPFAGVNPLMIDHISETLKGLKQQGKTICIIEHNRTKAKAIVDNTYLLLKGKITKESSE